MVMNPGPGPGRKAIGGNESEVEMNPVFLDMKPPENEGDY